MKTELGKIKLDLKKFLSGSLRISEIDDSDNIFENGVVHSLFFIQLLIFVEKKYKIFLGEGEFDIKRLNTVEAISNMIFQKIKSKVSVSE